MTPDQIRPLPNSKSSLLDFLRKKRLSKVLFQNSQLILLSDLKEHAPIVFALAKATAWDCFLDVRRDSIYDDDAPEDNTAVANYHEDDSRKQHEEILQGEVTILLRVRIFFKLNSRILMQDNGEIQVELTKVGANAKALLGATVTVVGKIVIDGDYDETYWG